MANISSKVKNRLVAGVKRFQPVLAAAKSRDVNESDTVTIITDMLADVFGFDKFLEVTSEYVIRGVFVDLAIKQDGKPQMLIEAKAINLELKDTFIRQAINYAANQGVEWVILTNGVTWQVYRVGFGKPISHELVIEIDFLNLNLKKAADLESLYMLSKEGIGKSMLGDYHAQRQALSRFIMGAMILSDPILAAIRRDIRKMSPDIKIETDEIRAVLEQEVLKREVLEGVKAEEAKRKIAKGAHKPPKKPKAKTPSATETKTPDNEIDLGNGIIPPSQ